MTESRRRLVVPLAVVLAAAAMAALLRRSPAAPVESEPSAPALPPAPLPPPPGPASKPPRRRRVRRIVAWSLLVLLLAAGGVAGWLYYEARDLVDELSAGSKQPVVQAARQELHVAPAKPLVEAPAPRPRTRVAAPPPPAKAQTILLIGSDRRWGSQQPGNSDTMLLVRLLPEQKSISLLSLPRDLLVPIAGHGRDRLNRAYYLGGERLLIATVRELAGVPIDHFVEVSLRGFGDVVTALGGVYLPVDQRYYNRHDGTEATNYAEIDLQPGYQKLTRADALAFVRYRHGDNDFVRAARQQLFLREALRQTVAAKYHFLRLRGILRAFARATASDIRSLGEIWRLVSALRSTPAERIRRQTVPATETVIDGADYVEASPEALKATLLRWYAPPPRARKRPAPRPAERPRPAPRPVPVTLYDDGGLGRALVAPLAQGMRTCVPTKLPPSYRWPSRDGARHYELAGHPAIAAYATAGPGTSLLWMETTWQDPPVLASPSATIRRAGRSYDLYVEGGGKVRQVAWRVGPTRVWLTNTLRNDLSRAQMLALAQSCLDL